MIITDIVCYFTSDITSVIKIIRNAIYFINELLLNEGV